MTSGPALVASCLSAVVVLGGCAALTADDADSGQVATSFYPLQYAAERVVGEHLAVRNLTRPGAEPHDLELSVAQTAEIAEAGLVVYLDGFQPAVDDAVEQNATGETLEVGAVVGLEPFDEHADEHADGEAHSEDDEHDHGEDDPHFWQDPLRMADVGDAIADDAAALDPDHADDYAAGAADLRADLEALDAAYAEGLASCERDTIVVSHDAFGYLAKYGVHLESIAGLSPDAEPTPADLARLQDLITAEGITTVFSESLVSPRIAESLADDLGIQSAVLDPVEGLSDRTEGEDYLSLMQDNLAALVKANGCSPS